MEGYERYTGAVLRDNRFCGRGAPGGPPVIVPPREVLREAFKANLISDDAWMDMLKVRNELAHDYDCEIVKKHCNTIVEKYIDLFYEFEEVVKKLGD